MKPKIVTLVGTRPEIIRLSELVKYFDQVFDHTFVHTGQNDHPKLKDVFFRDLGLREPDFYLDVDRTSFATVMAETITKTEDLLKVIRPDGMVVLGDTNSAIGLLVARRMGIPTYHLEAGNRSFDENVPEEINRRMVDHVADYNLVYNSYSYQNLIREGIHPRFLHITGSPLREVINGNLEKINSSTVLQSLGVDRKSYFLASIHRQENVDSKSRLQELLLTLAKVGETYGKPVLVSTHPRTAARIEVLGKDKASYLQLKYLEPLGYLDYMKLQSEAFCTMSDSGTISEESSMFGFPAVSLRDSFERWEASDMGTIVQSGIKLGPVVAAVERVTSDPMPVDLPEGYDVADFSLRVARYILSTYHSHKQWKNIRDIEL